MIIASTWQIAGVDMLLFFVGLDTIDREVVEAAGLDGAHGWSIFRHITMPSLAPMTRVIIAISIVNALQAFNLIWVMTQGRALRLVLDLRCLDLSAVVPVLQARLRRRHRRGADHLCALGVGRVPSA